MTRRPAVAGSFYPSEPVTLRKELDQLTDGRSLPLEPRALALLVPHAGYVYSGRIAARTYLSSRLPRTFVILGPNHTGEGAAIALMTEGEWSLPLGVAPIDAPLAAAILERCPGARADATAHRREHSLEVQIPFLQHLCGEFRFVPICVGTERLPLLLDLGRAVAEAVAASADETLLILSSDMSHYVPATTAERLDRLALERVLAIDPEGLHAVVRRAAISMCGVSPVVAGLAAARILGASSARLVAYGHSGERNGDYDSVVGYAGAAID